MALSSQLAIIAGGIGETNYYPEPRSLCSYHRPSGRFTLLVQYSYLMTCE